MQFATPTISELFCNSILSWSRSELMSWRSFCSSSFSWLIDEICSLSWEEWVALSANNRSFSLDMLFSVSVHCWICNIGGKKQQEDEPVLVYRLHYERLKWVVCIWHKTISSNSKIHISSMKSLKTISML